MAASLLEGRPARARLAVAAAALPLALFGLRWSATAAAAPQGRLPDRTLAERIGCGSAGGAASPDGADRTGDVISVRVDPTAVVEIDRFGTPIAAMTNTGCAPRPGDDLFIRNPDGTVEPVAAIDPPAHGWTGDFTRAGVYRLQHAP